VAGRGVAFRWTVALLSVGFILGAYVDAASRLVTPSPLAPWNDLLMDAAWLAVTGFMAVVFGRALARGVAWRAALPAGYHLALAGALVFGLGALADVYYQIAFDSAPASRRCWRRRTSSSSRAAACWWPRRSARR
jgi:hypothetical protein